VAAGKRDDVVVGSVILGAIVIILGAVLWVQQTEIGTRQDRVTARFRDVGNTQVGNAVVIRGVRAGRIESIELAPEGWVHVRMSLADDVALPEDPVVLLNAATLFGDWQAQVTTVDGIPDHPEVRQQLAEAGGARGILPGASLPDIAQLTTVAGRLAGDVATVAERFGVAFDDDAARELRGTIQNLAQLSGELAGTVRAQSRNLTDISGDVRAGVQTLNRTAEVLNATVQSLHRVSARADSLTAGEEPGAILADVTEAASEARLAAVRIRGIADELGRSHAQVQLLLARADSTAARLNRGDGSLGLLLTDESLYRQSDSLVTDMRALIADFRRDPRRYIRLSIF
jgi:phospholipid/cholesterol/gamma-HCH transport system substrate-binding protein